LYSGTKRCGEIGGAAHPDGFLKPQVGSIRVEGEEINGLSEEGMRAIRKRVTMVFQNGRCLTR